MPAGSIATDEEWRTEARNALALALVGLVLMGPALVFGTAASDSYIFNVNWMEQFSDEVAAGRPYPRWLPQAFSGYGSPSFYFYPPLVFWIASAVRGIGGGLLSAPMLVEVTAALLAVLSGLAAYVWLRGFARPKAAFIGAALYLATPYHVGDHVLRGAVGELAVYAILPLLVAALRATMTGGRAAPLALALSTAGLVLAHLPSAVIASATLIPAYGIFLFVTRRPPVADAARAVAALVLGGLLAAGYFVPALALTDHIDTDFLWSAYFRPDTWAVWNWSYFDNPFVRLLYPLAFVVAGIVCLLHRVAGPSRHPEATFWTAAVVVGVALMFCLVPGFWSLPFLRSVQFSWRIMLPIDLAAVTAAVILVPAIRPERRRRTLVAAAAFLLPAVATLAMLWVGGILHGLGDRRAYNAYWIEHRVDPGEYLPSTIALPWDRPQPLAALLPPDAGTVAATDAPDGSVAATVTIDREATLVLRRFAFPSWTVTDGQGRDLPVRAEGPVRLVAVDLPPGTHALRAAIGTLPVERLGWSISSAAAVALLGWSIVLAGRHRRRTPG